MTGRLSIINTANEKYVLWSFAPSRRTVTSELFRAPFAPEQFQSYFNFENGILSILNAQGEYQKHFTYKLMILRNEQFEMVLRDDSLGLQVNIAEDINGAKLAKRSMLFRLEPRDDSTQSSGSRQLSVLGQMFEEQIVGDFVFVVDGKEIKVLKLMLAAHSDVFSAMFESDMNEKKKGRVEVTDISYEGLHGLIKFIYTGRIDAFGLDGDFLVAADKYNVVTAKEAYVESAVQSLTYDNIDEMMMLAKKHNLPRLLAKCFEMAKTSPESKTLIAKLLARVE